MSLLGQLWEAVPGTKFIVAIRNGVVKPLPVKSPAGAALAAEKLTPEGYDLYFSPAGFHGDRRRQADTAGVGSFWLDLDCGPGKPYKHYLYAALALLKWCKESQFWMPSALVCSGYGLHAYWYLDAAYPREEWEPVAQHFKQALAVGKVYADPARTADSASIMRLPGSANHKNPQRPRPVEVLADSGRRLTLDEFRSELPSVGPIRALSRGAPQDSEWGIPENYPAGDAEGIAEKCAQIAHLRDTRGAVEEPLWRAGLSVVHRCADGDRYIQEWSQGDERYDPHETQAKAEGTKGPATCAHFSSLDPERCQGCPHAGKVTSPIQLALAGATPPAEDEPSKPPAAGDADWRPSSVGRFRITDAGIYYSPPVPEGSAEEPLQRITEVPIWVTEVRERARLDHEEDASSLMVEWRSIDGRLKRAVLRQANVHDLRAFKTWLADYNIIAAVHEVPLLVSYISQYTLKMLKRQGAKEYHESLGWYRDGFVVGDRVITKDGAKPALVQTTSPIAKITKKGSLEAWKDAVKVLERPEYSQHAFALLCGFGSPVLSLANVQSAVVSLVGQTGAGKTLAARTALSIYGPPEFLMQGATATSTAVEIQLGHNRHAPYLLDEVTHLPAHRLADLMYLAANGQGKAAGTRNREIRRVATWQLVPFISSNRPLREFNRKDFEAAHRARLLEIYFDRPMPSKDGARLHNGIEDNAGTAAEPYLRALAQVRDEIPALFAKVQAQVLERVNMPSEQRFSVWTLTAAVVGGMVAKAAGLIDLDPWAIVESVLGQVTEAVEEETRQSRPEYVGEVISEWLTRESRRICRWKRSARAVHADLGELVDDPIARMYGDGTIVVHKRELMEVLREEGITRRQLLAWLGGTKPTETSVRLAPGLPVVWSTELPTKLLGLEGDDE